MGEECVQGFDGKARRKETGRPRRIWEDGIRMDLTEIGPGSVDLIQLAQDRDQWRALVNTVMNLGFWCHRVRAMRAHHKISPCGKMV
jgi:hypothetical protein